MIVVGDEFDQLYASGGGGRHRRFLDLADLNRFLAFDEIALVHLHQVHHRPQLILSAQGQLHNRRDRVQAVANHFHRPLQAGAATVHLVYEGESGDPVAISLPPDRLGLWLHARDRIEHNNPTIENPQ